MSGFLSNESGVDRNAWVYDAMVSQLEQEHRDGDDSLKRAKGRCRSASVTGPEPQTRFRTALDGESMRVEKRELRKRALTANASTMEEEVRKAGLKRPLW